MKLSEIMSSQVEVVSPEASIQEIAQKMKQLDCGAIPVCENDRLIGMVTDRDITIQAVAEGKHDCKARDVMSGPIEYCFEDDNVEDAAQKMESKQVRRLVVLDQNKRLVGIVSLGDVAAKTQNEPMAGKTLEKISEPVRAKAA